LLDVVVFFGLSLLSFGVLMFLFMIPTLIGVSVLFGTLMLQLLFRVPMMLFDATL